MQHRYNEQSLGGKGFGAAALRAWKWRYCHLTLWLQGLGALSLRNNRKSVTSRFPSGGAPLDPMVTAGAHVCGYLPIQAT